MTTLPKVDVIAPYVNTPTEPTTRSKLAARIRMSPVAVSVAAEPVPVKPAAWRLVMAVPGAAVATPPTSAEPCKVMPPFAAEMAAPSVKAWSPATPPA